MSSKTCASSSRLRGWAWCSFHFLNADHLTCPSASETNLWTRSHRSKCLPSSTASTDSEAKTLASINTSRKKSSAWLLSIHHVRSPALPKRLPTTPKKVEDYMECSHAKGNPLKTSHCWGRAHSKHPCLSSFLTVSCSVSHNDHRHYILHVIYLNCIFN